MTYGIKISKPTKDISSTEPRDFVLNSEYNTVVIFKEAEVSVTINAGATVKSTITYDVAFDFVPVVMIFVELTAGSGRWYASPFTFSEASDAEDTTVSNSIAGSGVEKDKFYITFTNNNASQKTIKYRYYIFANLA
jgi:hypothetical protein